MEKLYKITLSSGLMAFIALSVLLVLSFAIENINIEAVVMPVIIVSGILILAGLVTLYSFFEKAKKLKSQRNISRSLTPLVVLLFNIPLIVVTYLTTDYVASTHTVTIENQSTKTIKKMFFSNSGQNYFVKPVEPGETFTKALVFKNKGKVEYTFNLDKKQYTGTLFENIEPGTGTAVKLSVSRTERVYTEEIKP